MPTKPTHTKRSSHRLGEPTLSQIREIGDALSASDTDVIKLATVLLHERLGLRRRDLVAVVEELARHHGDDGKITVTVTKLLEGKGTILVNGKRAPDWTVAILGAYGEIQRGGELVGSAGVTVRHDPTGLWFGLGRIEAKDGAKLTVRVRDLLDLATPPADPDSSPAEYRRRLAAEFELRRRLREAIDERDSAA
jgi:hypothetical protein